MGPPPGAVQADGPEPEVVSREGRVILDTPPGEAFGSRNWETLRSTGLEPPTAAVVAHRLGLGAIATEEGLVSALAAG